MMKARVLLAFTALTLSVVFVTGEARAISKVVAVGDTAPPPIGGRFATLGGAPPFLLGINDNADVLFWSSVTGGASDAGLFLFSNGQLQKVVANLDPAPIGGGGNFIDFRPAIRGYRLNNRGEVAFVGKVLRGSQRIVGIFLFSNGVIRKIVVEGDQVPGPALFEPKTQPDLFSPGFGFSFDLNDKGEIAFLAVQGKRSGATAGIYLFSGGGINRILTAGDQTEVGKLDLLAPVLGPFLNNNRQVAFSAPTSDPATKAVFLCVGGNCQKVVAVGDLIPGGPWPDRGVCCVLGFNNAGKIALEGLSPRGEILLWSAGDRRTGPIFDKVAEPGNGIEGTLDMLDGVSTGALGPDALNDLDQLVFPGNTTGGTQGLFLASAGRISRVLAASDQTPIGGTFVRFERTNINNTGCIAFGAELIGVPGVFNALFVTEAPNGRCLVTKIVDKSGATRFHYLIVEASDDLSGFGDKLGEALGRWPRKAGSTLKVTKPRKWQEAIDEINMLRDKAEPGDEVVIANLGHGSATELVISRHTPENEDQELPYVRLSQVISGFKKSVTMTVFLGGCFGGFAKGVLAQATNKDGEKYGSHLFVIGKAGDAFTFHITALEEAAKDDDNNGLPDGDNGGDGVLTSFELEKFFDGLPGSDIIGQAPPGGTPGQSLCVLPVVNDLVSLAPLDTFFDPTPVPNGPVGTFTIRATFTNTSSTPILNPLFEVVELSSGNLLLNANGGPGGVGARLTPNVGADGILSPSEPVTVEFVIGLQTRDRFTFFVNVLGVPSSEIGPVAGSP